MQKIDEIILIVGIILFGYAMGGLRHVLFRNITIEEYLSDRKNVLCGISGIILIVYYFITFESYMAKY